MNVKRILATKGKNVIAINPQATIKEAIMLLSKHNIGALVVLDEQAKITGIISERDIIHRAAQTDDVLSQHVHELMTTDVITGMPQDDLHSIANVMTENRVRHLPICEYGQLVGIISIGDVVKVQRDEYKGTVETLQTQLLADQEPEI